jgi:L-serine dehydratase
MARDLMDGDIESVRIEFDADGSLATTHTTQGSDMGLLAGLLGWEATDERLADSSDAVRKAGINVAMKVVNLGATHPNTYKLTLANPAEKHSLTAVSTGGGMIEIVDIDGVRMSLAGDYYETLVFLDTPHGEILEFLETNIEADWILLQKNESTEIVEIKARSFPERSVLTRLCSRYGVKQVKTISPVLPILSRQGMQVPFLTSEEMRRYNAGKNLELWELAIRYESSRGGIPGEQVFQMMSDIVLIMRESIRTGLKGTRYADRILGCQSGFFRTQMENERLLDGGLLNRIILYVTAMMEVKSSMGVIVAAPTAGACGVLPGAILGAADVLGSSPDEMTKALLAAGMIGVFIAARATFAAEIGGCQAECGAGSGMAAAALVTLAKGNLHQACNASSMALQNILGMICDPVASRVEAPCLGKNVMAAANALACANMALSDFDAVIPLDEVIETMDRVGKSLPQELRCTARGGLSVTRTSMELEKKLKTSPQNPDSL